MTIYYRMTDGATVNISQAQYDALTPNKQGNLRIFIVDPVPAATATQIPDLPSVVVGPVEAHLVTLLRNKTQAEIDIADLNAESATNAQLILDIQTQLAINNATFNALTDPQKIAVLRDDRRLVLRAVRYLLRRTP